MPTSSRATPSSPSRSSPSAASPAMPAPARWTPIADLAERYSFDEVRVTHEQNLVLPHVRLGRPARGLQGAQGHRPGRGQRRARHRHHRLPRPRLLRARQRPLDPDRAAHLRRASPRARTRSATSRSRSPAASTPAATTTSATSASWASRSAARSTTSSCSAAPARRMRRSPPSPAPASAPTASSMRSRRWSTPISSCAPARERALPRRLRPPRPRAPFKEALYAATLAATCPPSPLVGRVRWERASTTVDVLQSRLTSPPHAAEARRRRDRCASDRDPSGSIWRRWRLPARRLGEGRGGCRAARRSARSCRRSAGWRSESALASRNAPLGLLIEAGEAIDDIAADLPRFA